MATSRTSLLSVLACPPVELQEAAQLIKGQTNFFAFAKTNTQVKNFTCTLLQSAWQQVDEGVYIYNIEGNRFLRGMVRLLTATQLKIGRGQLAQKDFETFFTTEKKCGFSVPPDGLFLNAVKYPVGYFDRAEKVLETFKKNI